jgi:S-formylglutathione hydrolase FrmB
VTSTWTTTAALLADSQAAPYRHGVSLLHGWVPATIEAITVTALLSAVGWRSRRWRLLWLPSALLFGTVTASWAHWYVDMEGMSDDPAPRALWIWMGLSGLAFAVLIVGWNSARWWRRSMSLVAVPLCLLSTGLALNQWVGYFPTVQTAWNQLTAGPLPDETDISSVTAMQQNGTVPVAGTVVPVTIDSDASHFKHRSELVYLPPAWYATNPPPKLPVILMIGGEFNTPADWLRTGNAARTIDDFARTHGGNAPVFVFADSGGSFNNDTECVNGSRGNAADHLTKDIVPYMISHFGTSADSANWGVVGWSMGGTCAVDLTVMHPELFSSFVDIAGDLAPTAGTKEQTIARLFRGDANAWAAFDPSTVITKHGPYQGVSGWFAISDTPQTPRRNVDAANDAVGLGGRDAAGNPGDQTQAADTLCALGQENGISCAVVATTGKHDWPFATQAFASSLPWLAGQLGTPGAVRIPLPKTTSSPTAK